MPILSPTFQPPARQRGLTLISTLILIACGVVALYLGGRILPAYSQHATVVKVMREVGATQDPSAISAFELRRKLMNALEAAGVTSVDRRDFTIARTRRGVTLSVQYEVPIHVYGSLGLVAKFDRTIPVGEA